MKTHSDDARRRAAELSRSWQGSVCATCRRPDSTLPATAIIAAALTAADKLAAPHPAPQHPHRHSSACSAQSCSSSAQRDPGRTGPAETANRRHLPSIAGMMPMQRELIV